MERVLIINDCRFESMLFKDMLSDLGYQAKVADEYETLTAIKDYYPDIIIANLIMKKNTGDMLIETIKNKYPHIRCYLSSCNNISLKDYEARKVDGVINTPIQITKLKELLISSPKTKADFMFCPFCGKKLGAAGRFAFCPYCGNILKNEGK